MMVNLVIYAVNLEYYHTSFMKLKFTTLVLVQTLKRLRQVQKDR